MSLSFTKDLSFMMLFTSHSSSSENVTVCCWRVFWCCGDVNLLYSLIVLSPRQSSLNMIEIRQTVASDVFSCSSSVTDEDSALLFLTNDCSLKSDRYHEVLTYHESCWCSLSQTAFSLIYNSSSSLTMYNRLSVIIRDAFLHLKRLLTLTDNS